MSNSNTWAGGWAPRGRRQQASPVAVNYGAGTNSTALLVGMHERGLPAPNIIVFADTGGERPETYTYLDVMDRWLASVGWPKITRVRWIRIKAPYAGKFISLEDLSLMRRELPSLAYGFKGCSTKWKIQPVERYIEKTWPMGVAAIAAGTPIVRLLGIDACEKHRAKQSPFPKWQFRYPLIDWGWCREECVEAIERAGLPQPGKSSCFFCPSMRKDEIVQLGREHPKLLARAIAMEDRAEAKEGSTIIGLGRSHYRWRDVWAAAQGDAEAECRVATGRDIDGPCGCYDG